MKQSWGKKFIIANANKYKTISFSRRLIKTFKSLKNNFENYLHILFNPILDLDANENLTFIEVEDFISKKDD